MNVQAKKFCRRVLLEPIAGRFLGASVCVALLLWSSIAAAQSSSTLTESEAVDRALSVEGIQVGWSAEVEGIEAQSRATRRWPNPEVSYSREQTLLDGDDVAEDFILLEQALPIGGQRRLLAQASEIRASARASENRAEARDLAADVRRAFYQVLYYQKRSEIFSRWLDEMRRLEKTFKKRVAAGETAPYELDRLQVEISEIESKMAVEEAELARQRARLAGLVGASAGDDQPSVDGTLLPASLPSESELRATLADRPSLVASTRRVEAAQRRLKAAKRQWVPEPTVTGGYKRSSSGGQVDHGFVAGVALEIPVADRGKASADAIRSEKIRAKSRAKVQRTRLTSTYLGLLNQARLLRDAAEKFEDQGLAAAQAVYETARKSYRAGEAGILELVDAYRRQIDARLRTSKLAFLARQAEIALEENP
jgi:cobalt-zinc-cadmium efflux system outer membrane protein